MKYSPKKEVRLMKISLSSNEKKNEVLTKRGSSDNENSFPGNEKKNEVLTEKEVRLMKILFRIMKFLFRVMKILFRIMKFLFQVMKILFRLMTIFSPVIKKE